MGMVVDTYQKELYLRELRLFLEEICTNICRFEHVEQLGLAPEEVKTNQEYYLGAPDAYADIRVEAKGISPYFVEIKYGYSGDQLVRHMARKYGIKSKRIQDASKLIIVIDCHNIENWKDILRRLESSVQKNLRLDIWDEQKLLSLFEKRYGEKIDRINFDTILKLKFALRNATGKYAFGSEWEGDSLQTSLLWHFPFWRIKYLRETKELKAWQILPPGMYKSVVALMADLSSFSSFVRDTRDDDVVRHALTAFYSKARLEILNTGGMLYQFVGDEVIGLYGIPDHPPGYRQAAYECAKNLVSVGDSIANEWQRRIDRVQGSRGVHIGMAIGYIQVVSLRPFSRSHLGAVSDSINMAARLLSSAGPANIVVSNTFYQGLSQKCQGEFTEIDPVDGKNVGRIMAWKTTPKTSYEEAVRNM